MILRQCKDFSLSRRLAENGYRINHHTFNKLQRGEIATVETLTRYLLMLKDSCLDLREYEKEALILVEILVKEEEKNSEKIVSSHSICAPKKKKNAPRKMQISLSRTMLAEQLFYPSTGASALNQLNRYIESHPSLKQQLAASGYFNSTRGLTQEQDAIIRSAFER